MVASAAPLAAATASPPWDPCTVDSAWATAGVNCQQWYSTFEVVLPGNSINGAGPYTHDPLSYQQSNGPAGYEDQSIPASPDIPARFVGLPDIQIKPAINTTNGPGDAPYWVQSWPGMDASTWAILGVQAYSTFTIAGNSEPLTPYGYLGAETLGHTWTTPGNEFYAYYGYWRDLNHDNVIQNENCNGPGFCSQTDEFIFAGVNTYNNAQAVTGIQWVFPTGTQQGAEGTASLGDSGFLGCGPLIGCSSTSTDVANVVVGSGLAGDCRQYQTYDADCISPAPEGTFNDASANQSSNQEGWWGGGVQGGSGWSNVMPEESLLISRYVVNVFGPTGLNEPGNAYGYEVDAGASTQGFFRDMNWYQAVAPSAVSNLYMSEMRSVRDNVGGQLYTVENTSVGVPANPVTPVVLGLYQSNVEPSVNSTVDSYNNASDTANYGCLPSSPVTSCQRDIRQLTAVWNAENATAIETPYPLPQHRPLIGGSFDATVTSAAQPPPEEWFQYYCSQASVDCSFTGGLPVGVGGQQPTGFSGFGRNGDPITGFVPSATFIGGSMTMYTWQDTNGDGYIGAPDNYTIDHYLSGAFYTANVGTSNDTITGLTQFAQGITVTPNGAWPPGTFLDSNADGIPYDTAASGQGNTLTPLSGTGSVTLRPDTGYCGGGAASCPTQDVLLIPTGDALGLHGHMATTLKWEEGTPPAIYHYSWSGSVDWDQSVN
ncbi:MAG: hypothetical protein ACYDDF_09600 [Thermoplasmatota archaeon]